MPAAQLVVLQDCGHFSYLERPDAVRQTLNAFFARQFSSTEGAHRLGS
jgi:pimeloyl-ACP methyl ester carboxylesterase